jgi:2-phospho-L-lactate/phosphoenolpyruvate guanylyltransferase
VNDRLWAVIVARAGNGAKSRLGHVLSPSERTLVARAMLADVLDVCIDASEVLAGTLVVVDDAARDLAAGAVLVLDDAGSDMNAAVRAGVAAALKRGATAVLVLPGDIPLISTADLREIAAVAGESPRAVVVASSRDGQGTNALLLRPPNVIAPAFGPPSVQRHLDAGRAAGARALLIAGLGLARDVDTPPDLANLLDAPVGEHTSAALARLIAERAAKFIRI